MIAEGRAYGTSSPDACVSPDMFADGLKMMISRWRRAGIVGNWQWRASRRRKPPIVART